MSQPTTPPEADRHDLIPTLHVPFDADNAPSLESPIGWGDASDFGSAPAGNYPTWLKRIDETGPDDPVSMFDVLGLTPPPRGSLPPTEVLEANVTPVAASADVTVERRTELPIVEDQFIIFTLAHTEYALRLSAVVEINPRPVLTPLPSAPVWVLGSTNLRGDVVPVLDLRLFFGYPVQHSREERLVVVQDVDGLKAGLVVDSIRGLRRLTIGTTQQAVIGFDEQITRYIKQLTEYDNRSLAIFDTDRLLANNPVPLPTVS